MRCRRMGPAQQEEGCCSPSAMAGPPASARATKKRTTAALATTPQAAMYPERQLKPPSAAELPSISRKFGIPARSALHATAVPIFRIHGLSWDTMTPTMPAKKAAMMTAFAVGPVRFDVILSKASLNGSVSPPAAKAVAGSPTRAVAAASPRPIQRPDIEVLLRLETSRPG